jgi:hypothetical protein
MRNEATVAYYVIIFRYYPERTEDSKKNLSQIPLTGPRYEPVTSPKRRTAINTKATINFLTPVPHLFIILQHCGHKSHGITQLIPPAMLKILKSASNLS